MTFNELFSKIGNAFGNFFNYLGNTPIEDLFANLGWIIFTIIICIISLLLIFGGLRLLFGLIGIILEKILPPRNKSKMPPLEQQSMYKAGKKLKKFLNK
jgi:hypothetical protein